MDICLCSEGFICHANATPPRPPCTCAPDVTCAVCLDYGEVPYHGRHYLTHWKRGETVEIDRVAVAQCLKAWLKTHKLTAEKAALILGVTKSSVLAFLHAKTRYPMVHTMQALREIVGVPEEALCPTATLPPMDRLPLSGLPAYVRQYRRVKHVTQEQLAMQVGCSPNTIKNLEAGRYTPRPHVVEALSTVLGVPIDALVA